MEMKARFFFTLTLLIVLNIGALPCFAQSAAHTQLKMDESCSKFFPPSHCPDGVSLSAVAFSPDVRTLAGVDGTILYFWDVSTGEIIHKLSPCSGTSSPELAFSPDGGAFARVSNESFACVWNVSAGLTVHEHELEEHGGNQVNSIAFSPDGHTLANGIQQNPEGGGFVRLWDVSTGATIRRLEHPSNVIQVAFSPDGGTLASWSGDGIIRFWDVSTGVIVRTIENMWGINDLVFSPDGGTLAIRNHSFIHLWDVSTDAIIRRIGQAEGLTNAALTSAAFSPCGRTLASAHADEIIHVWDVSTGKPLHTFEGHTSSRFEDDIVGIAFSQDGGTLVSVNRQGTVLLWDLVPCKPKPERLAADVNGDGQVDVLDLVAVAAAFGETGETPADVNEDGVVDIRDLVAVAAAFGETVTNAPSASFLSRDREFAPTKTEVEQWLVEAQQLNLTDDTVQRGIRYLEQLLLTLTPKETVLLANYPNPFNPETWMPYQLAQSANVSISIYGVDGRLVRTLSLGHQATGIYQSRSRAAYWDGRNNVGEPVASGVYFYTLTAGDFTATRKMLIRK